MSNTLDLFRFQQEGTNFPDGTRAGKVITPLNNSNALGEAVANSICYSIKPIASQNIVTSVELDSNKYVIFTGNLTANFEYDENLQVVPLDVCRIISITSTAAFSVHGSFLDFYGQKMTCGGDAVNVGGAGVYIFDTPRGVGAISSIQITGSTAALTILTKDEVELPYASYDENTIVYANYGGEPLLKIVIDAVTPYKVTPAYTLVNSTYDQSDSTGNPRPIIRMNETTFGTAPFNGSNKLVIVQSISGYGFNTPPKVLSTETELMNLQAQKYLNNLDYVIGFPSYVKNWTGWQS